MTKAPTPTEKSKKQRNNIKTPPKISITQRLRTDLGRSAGVTQQPNWCAERIFCSYHASVSTAGSN